MKDFLLRLFNTLGKSLQKLAADGENQCRRCGMCHHACQILKNKNSRKFREE